MPPFSHPDLSRRERQIMDVIYTLGSASAGEVRERLPNAPSDSAVRTMLRLLEERGHLKHTKEGRKFVFHPVVAPKKASRFALRKLVQTFFAGSTEAAIASLLDNESRGMSREELERLSRLIEAAKEKGGRS